MQAFTYQGTRKATCVIKLKFGDTVTRGSSSPTCCPLCLDTVKFLCRSRLSRPAVVFKFDYSERHSSGTFWDMSYVCSYSSLCGTYEYVLEVCMLSFLEEYQCLNRFVKYWLKYENYIKYIILASPITSCHGSNSFIWTEPSQTDYTRSMS